MCFESLLSSLVNLRVLIPPEDFIISQKTEDMTSSIDVGFLFSGIINLWLRGGDSTSGVREELLWCVFSFSVFSVPVTIRTGSSPVGLPVRNKYRYV